MRHIVHRIVAVALALGATMAAQSARPDLTTQDIEMAVGDEPQARAMVSEMLTDLLSGRGAATIAVLSSQLPEECLPAINGIEFVRISNEEATARLDACLSYVTVWHVRRSAHELFLSIQERERCRSRGRDRHYTLDGTDWKRSTGRVSGGGSVTTDCP